MAANEIIDPTEQNQVSLRHKFLQIGVPILGVLLILVTIGGIGLHSYRTTRAGVLKLTRDLLVSVQRYVVQDVSGYLGGATVGSSFAQDFIGHAPENVASRAFNAYGASMLRLVPQIQSFYLAGEDGSFLLVERDPHGKGLEYTQIRTNGPSPVFHHDFYDENGKLLRSEENPTDGYDPRTRAWYKATQASSSLAWTPPTIYAASGQFVVTASIGVTNLEGHKQAFAINVSLNLLSKFLDDLKIGESGKAVILDRTGHIIAGHDFQGIVARAGGDPQKMVLDPATQGTFLRVYDNYRVRGNGSHPIRMGKNNYIGMAQELPSTDGWVLLIVAAESDFASFARQSGRESLQFSVIIVFLAILLAGLLARQSRRTEHVQRNLDRQKAQTDTEAAALQQVAAAPGLLDAQDEALVLTEEIARVTAARRVSLWRLLHDGTALVCEDSYDASVDAHSGGFELSRREAEEFFRTVDEGNTVSVDVAAADPRMSAFERLVMRDAGTRSLMLCPVHGVNNGATGIIGAITLENAHVAPHLVYFLQVISSIVAIRFGNTAETPAPGQDEASSVPTTATSSLPPPRYDEALLPAPKIGGAEPQGQFPSVAVMVIAFSDPVMETEEAEHALLPLIDRIAAEVQEIARRYSLFSVKLAGHRLICVAGCTPEPDPTAVWRLAEAALSLRETCMMLLATANIEPIFSIGMDFGPAMGGELGQDPKIFNLWGETVTLAELMAQGAPDVGTIEVTERVYMALRDRYLFRSRGSFYAPRSGIGRVYVLATRR